MGKLTHFNEEGRAKMVNVGEKLNTKRVAIAQASIYMKSATLQKIMDEDIAKGDVLGVSQIGGIMAAKRTAELIPMCHNIFLTGADITFEIDESANKIVIEATVSSTGKTGVEMEALTAVSIAALTIYDMCKAIDRGMKITDIKLLRKEGGKTGTFVAEE